MYKKFKVLAEKEFDKILEILRTYGRVEYTPKEFKFYCDSNDIVHEVTAPDTRYHNGLAKRRNKTFFA